MLVLLQAEHGGVFLESSQNRNLVWPVSYESCKAVLALLEKIVALYMDLTTITAWKPCFQRSFTRLLFCWATTEAGTKAEKGLKSKTVLKIN